jgi:hypothetical protein
VINRFGYAFINPQPGFFLDSTEAGRARRFAMVLGRIVSSCGFERAMDHRNSLWNRTGQLANFWIGPLAKGTYHHA